MELDIEEKEAEMMNVNRKAKDSVRGRGGAGEGGNGSRGRRGRGNEGMAMWREIREEKVEEKFEKRGGGGLALKHKTNCSSLRYLFVHARFVVLLFNYVVFLVQHEATEHYGGRAVVQELDLSLHLVIEVQGSESELVHQSSAQFEDL